MVSSRYGRDGGAASSTTSSPLAQPGREQQQRRHELARCRGVEVHAASGEGAAAHDKRQPRRAGRHRPDVRAEAPERPDQRPERPLAQPRRRRPGATRQASPRAGRAGTARRCRCCPGTARRRRPSSRPDATISSSLQRRRNPAAPQRRGEQPGILGVERPEHARRRAGERRRDQRPLGEALRRRDRDRARHAPRRVAARDRGVTDSLSGHHAAILLTPLASVKPVAETDDVGDTTRSPSSPRAGSWRCRTRRASSCASRAPTAASSPTADAACAWCARGAATRSPSRGATPPASRSTRSRRSRSSTSCPAQRALSFGMLGCDLHCAYCQNWVTSQTLRDPEASARGACR